MDYCNAFFDGTTFTFGDGCDKIFPLVCLDVVAHEIAHSITDRYSGLYNTGQAGGINEAFSDMSGELAEVFSDGINDWAVSHDLKGGVVEDEERERV
jgi:Zn-dependent metalloprotease